ncbi:alpha-L-rhamnosidase C-terminal domain-containing protein [Cesiribacter sp. SM1]|uniref:alpha-L-rhamnosidase-related protein n=1 Tax=Cesiribacter sp. SM1 TaxID=2861196 RepID=UPI001CD66A61|nr:alpha-L-rhamnosidase C-terminal domain-containing protein [Cesiribacter sp. SM1]
MCRIHFFLVSLVLAGICLPSLLLAQLPARELPAALLQKPWPAKWIFMAGEDPKAYGVYHFRKSVTLPAKPAAFPVHVSADNRYKLFVNGTLVCWGPARSDVYHWNFETIDLAPYLKEGNNVLAAQVWNWGEHKPMSQQSRQTAFILQGNSAAEEVVNTGASWKSWKNSAYAPLLTNLHTYFVIDPGEEVDFNNYPWQWEQPGFDDSGWTNAIEISPGLAYGLFEPWYEGWMLRQRQIPPMALETQRIPVLRSAAGMQPPAGFPGESKSIHIPANTKATLLLDQTYLTTAYPVLHVSGGKGAVVSLKYAESMFVDEGKPAAETKQKGNRNKVAGKVFIGYEDRWTLDGGSQRTIVPLFWRTWRYLQLQIRTGAEPLELDDLYGLYTGYPFERKASFDAGVPELSTILDVGWRSARLCAHETYMDTPYYEQLQYVGDTRIQALVSLYNSGDDRLMRNAIEQISFSQSLGGLTMSRYPSREAQYITPFSLWWISMLHDHWKYRGDTSFVKAMLPVSRSVLDFYHGYQQPRGSLKRMPYWNFTDWASGPGWKAGIAPATAAGASAPLDLQLLIAYRAAALLERAAGLPALAAEYESRSEDLSRTIAAVYWDVEEELFADTPEKRHFSQHTNALAVLAGVVEGATATSLMEKTLAQQDLVQATIYFKFYLHAAAIKAGLGNGYIGWLDEWRAQLKRGLTTWAEQPEPTRSDCHAWGASPNIEFFRTVLGIDSDAPGFAKVLIEPRLGELKKVSGSVPHPKGEISVRYHVNSKGKLQAEVSLPEGVEGRFVWHEQEKPLKSGRQLLKW